MSISPATFRGDPNLPWYWEGNVQAQIAKFLVYSRGNKAGQPKPTGQPNLQARIWLAEAVLAGILLGS